MLEASKSSLLSRHSGVYRGASPRYGPTGWGAALNLKSLEHFELHHMAKSNTSPTRSNSFITLRCEFVLEHSAQLPCPGSAGPRLGQGDAGFLSSNSGNLTAFAFV